MAAISDDGEELPGKDACSNSDAKPAGQLYVEKLTAVGNILGELGRMNQWSFITFAFDDSDYTG